MSDSLPVRPPKPTPSPEPAEESGPKGTPFFADGCVIVGTIVEEEERASLGDEMDEAARSYEEAVGGSVHVLKDVTIFAADGAWKAEIFLLPFRNVTGYPLGKLSRP